MPIARHRPVLVIAIAALASMSLTAACASGGPSSGGTPPPQSTLIRGARSSLEVMTQSEGAERVDTLPVPAQRVYDAIPRVLQSLNFRITALDPTALRVSAEGTQFRRVLDGERLSHFLSCGVSAMGNNADLYTVTIRVQSWAEGRGPADAALHNVVTASARPSDNGSGAAVNCATNGRLEGKIRAKLVVALMGAK